MFKKNGFTLLELLVSISIIAILISLASVSYSNAQKKSRDAKRQGDLKAIQTSLEQYYSVCGYVYPTAMPAVGAALTCAAAGSNFIDTVPSDPKTGVAYDAASIDANGYQICAYSSEIAPTPCVKNLQ